MLKHPLRSVRAHRLARRAVVAGGAGLLVITSMVGLTSATAQGPTNRFCQHHPKKPACIAKAATKVTAGVRQTRRTKTTLPAPEPTSSAPTTTAPETTTTPAPEPITVPTPTTCASKIDGVTVDDVSNLSALTSGLASLPTRATTRVVFDENVDPSYYVAPLAAIHPVSDVMGELLDSEYVKTLSVSDYVARARSYVATLGDEVDIWEVGNEVNGNWLGSYPDVSAKIDGAYNVANDAGKKTALTLYYNPNNVDGPGEPTPIAFSQQYVPADMRAGLDYVFVSYYETDFENYRPSAAVLTALFEQLHALYPHAVLGFGEVGLDNYVTESTLSRAESIMSYYYGLSIPLPYYCGGYFWWGGAEDIFGTGAPLSSQFRSALASMP
jgi:hypothetical protein